MFQDIFLQMYQTLDQLEERFDLVDDLDEELSLLEKYLAIKEMSEDLNSEIEKLHNKIRHFETLHGLTDPDLQEFTENKQSPNNNGDIQEDVVIELDENDFLTFQKGIGFYDLWMYDQAITQLEQINQKYPDFNLARLYTAMTYFKKAKYSDSKREVALLFKFSDDPDLISLGHNILGMVYSFEKEYTLSIEHFKNAIKLKENWNEPKFNLAIIYLKSNMIDEAIKLLEELYYNNPQDWEVLLYLGKAYQKIGQFELASELFKQIYRTTKKPLAIKQIIKHLEQTRQFNQAVFWYEKWLNIEPNNITVMIGLAKNLWLNGKKIRGIGVIKKVISLERENVEALLIYAWFLTDENNSKVLDILESLDKIKIELNETNSIILANLARLYYLNNEQAKAERFCDLLLQSQLKPVNSLGNLVKGLIYLDNGLAENALKHFEESVSLTKFPFIDFYIGYTHYLLGSLEEAKISWSNLVN